jgi:hypothetical protein
MKRAVLCAVMLAAALVSIPNAAEAAKKKPPAKPNPPAAAPAPAPAPAPAAAPTPAPAPAPSAPPKEIKAAPATAAPTPAPAAKKEKDDLDFDLLGKSQKMNPEELAAAERIEQLAKTRRTMLMIHQALGFTLMGVATANTAIGTLNYWDKFGGGGFTNNFELLHLISSMTTAGVFTAQGLIALFAPDPYDKPGRWDSARVHRILMAASTVGMIAQIVLGFVSSTRLGHTDQRDFARIHLGVGYATYALTMAGGLVYLF